MNTVTVEQLIEEAKNQGIELTAEEAKEALETAQSIDLAAEDGELSDDALEDVAGGISTGIVNSWLKKKWDSRPSNLGTKSPGSISAWERTVIAAAKAQFGPLGAVAATAWALLH